MQFEQVFRVNVLKMLIMFDIFRSPTLNSSWFFFLLEIFSILALCLFFFKWNNTNRRQEENSPKTNELVPKKCFLLFLFLSAWSQKGLLFSLTNWSDSWCEPSSKDLPELNIWAESRPQLWFRSSSETTPLSASLLQHVTNISYTFITRTYKPFQLRLQSLARLHQENHIVI